MKLLTTLVWFIACTLFCSTVSAQGYGDYNNDGNIDGADFSAFGSCMGGPTGDAPAGGCLAFDFDIDMGSGPDGHVDMQDFAAFQRAAPRQQGSCSALKLHAGARKVAPEITACGAIILTVTNVTLCDEGNVGPAATSDAWVGVEYIGPGQQPGELPEKWAQVGYSAKTRIAGSAIIFPPYIWAETNAGPLPDQYNFHPISIHPQTQLPVPGPAGGRPTYDCYQDFESGTWVYRFNFFEFWNWVDPYGGWKGTTGTRYSWAAEVHNKEDGMVGREGQECDFSFLFHAENWGGVEQDFVTELHLFSEDPAQFGTKLSAPDFSDTFLVWDKEP